MERIRLKFKVIDGVRIHRLLLYSGEVIEEIGMIEKGDKILAELRRDTGYISSTTTGLS